MATVSPIPARLRPIEPRPVLQDGQRAYLLRDPLELSDHVLVAPPALAAALAFCDGARDAEGICAAFAACYGQRLPIQAVIQLLAALDEACLLDNARAAQAQAAAQAAYRRAPFRPPACAGQNYPDRAGALRDALNELLAGADSPADSPRRHRGLISPHIDYPRGGHIYASVWKQLAPAVEAADLAILIGTDHAGDDPFTLTGQHYATPYGVLPTDRAVVAGLAEAIGAERAFAGELRHRSEHSLELPLVWFHHLRDGRPCDVVPILCGSMSRFDHAGGPAADATIGAFLAALKALTAGRRVLVIASGDLAHVGPAFGGDPLDEGGRARILADDDALVTRVCDGDAEAFHAAIHHTGNRNNVCGVGPIYLALRALEQARGEPTGYDHCPADDAGTSIVSVCGVSLE